MTSDRLSIAKASQTLTFGETRAFRYQESEKMVAVFEAFNWDKVNGMSVELTCYAPANRAMSKTELLGLLQSIFGNKAAVSLTNK